MFDDLFERAIDDLRQPNDTPVEAVENDNGNWDTGQVWSTDRVPKDVWTPN